MCFRWTLQISICIGVMLMANYFFLLFVKQNVWFYKTFVLKVCKLNIERCSHTIRVGIRVSKQSCLNFYIKLQDRMFGNMVPSNANHKWNDYESNLKWLIRYLVISWDWWLEDICFIFKVFWPCFVFYLWIVVLKC